MITLRVSAAASLGLTQAHITLERADKPTTGPIPQNTRSVLTVVLLGTEKDRMIIIEPETLFLSHTLHWLGRKKRKALC